LFVNEKSRLAPAFFLTTIAITSCQRQQVQQMPAQVQLDQQQGPRQVQQVQRPEPMRFQQLFHRMQPKRGSTELQSKQNDS
jgi:hypothetical protein